MAEECMVRLKSSDDQIFKVELAVALESQYIKNIIEDTGMESDVPVLNVSSEILAKVIEYCEYHVHAAKTSDEKSAISEEDMKTWDKDFVKLNMATLFHLIMAAKYLNINNLLDLACRAVVDMIKRKSPEEMRKIFKVENDYTSEEEEELRHQDARAYGT